jgi:hypothetical protein
LKDERVESEAALIRNEPLDIRASRSSGRLLQFIAPRHNTRANVNLIAALPSTGI